WHSRRVDWGPTIATTVAGTRLATDVRLVPSARLVGSVVDADDEPVEGATVRVHKVGDGSAASFDLELQTLAWSSDAQGAFLIGALPGGPESTTSAPSPGRAPPVAVGGSREGADAPIPLRSPPSRAVDVLVVDDAGAPVAGAGVAATANEPVYTLV